MAGLSLQRRGWRASARRFDTDARGIVEVGNRPDSALGPNVARTGTLQWYALYYYTLFYLCRYLCYLYDAVFILTLGYPLFTNTYVS